MLAGAFGLFVWHRASGASLAEARTVAMNVFVVIEIIYLLNCRSLDGSFLRIGAFSNPWVWAGMASMLVLQLLMTYLPVMNRVFATAPIGIGAWLEIALVAGLASTAVAVEKRFTRRWAAGCGDTSARVGRSEIA
jgi:Ca2+-transporting ATPase